MAFASFNIFSVLAPEDPSSYEIANSSEIPRFRSTSSSSSAEAAAASTNADSYTSKTSTGSYQSPETIDIPISVVTVSRNAQIDIAFKYVGHPHGHTDGGLNNGIQLLRDPLTKALLVSKTFHDRDVTSGHAMREIRYLLQLKECSNVVRITHHKLNGSMLWMEYCRHDSLARCLAKFRLANVKVPEAFVWHVFRSMARAICYALNGVDCSGDAVVTQGKPGWNAIVHRDIKPGNIFLSKEDGQTFPRVVSADYGCAISLADLENDNASTRVSRLTRCFAAPEWCMYIGDDKEKKKRKRKRNWYQQSATTNYSSRTSNSTTTAPRQPNPLYSPAFSRRSDIYQLGLVILCMIHGVKSPSAIADFNRFDDVPLPLLGHSYSNELHDAILACLKANPAHRLSSRELPAFLARKHEVWVRRNGKFEGEVSLPEEFLDYLEDWELLDSAGNCS